MKHWATKYIGQPWRPGGCWLLLQQVFKERHGVDMPDVQLGDFGAIENVSAIRKAAQRSGWKRVDGEPEADDIVLMMRVVDRDRHVGYMIKTIRGLRLLHCDGHMTERGPSGSTVAVPLKEAMADGYSEIELWRKA